MTAEETLRGEVSLLRLYTLSGDHFQGRSLSDGVLEAAHRAGLAGVTVLRGMMGFGRHGFDGFFNLMEAQPGRQPVIVEIVDTPARLEAFLRDLRAAGLPDRLATLERAGVVAYRAGRP